MQSDEKQASSFSDNWPSVLNRMLIGIGVIALGFFAADKALESFKSQESTASIDPAVVETTGEVLKVVEPVHSMPLPAADELAVAEPQAPIVVERPKVVGVVVPDEDVQQTESTELIKTQDSFVTTVADNSGSQESVLEQLEHVFGSAVVIISATEPAYVETENERRFLIGSILKNDRILSSISTSQLVVSRVGERRVYELPDASVQ